MGSTPRGISGSRASAILGLSEYQSAFEAFQVLKEECYPGWNAAHGYLLPEPPDNAAIRWGTAFESSVIELAEAKRGMGITNREWLYAHLESGGCLVNPVSLTDDAYVTCHIDGVYENFETLHEGKTTSMMNFWDSWGTPGTDRVPQGYQVQVQHQMLCTGASECNVSVLTFPKRVDEWEKEGWVTQELSGIGAPGKYALHKQHAVPGGFAIDLESRPIHWASTMAEMGFFHQYPVPASPSLQKTLVEFYSDFWARYIKGNEEPDFTRYDDIRRAFPEPVGTIVLTEQEERWVSERKLIKDEIKESGRLGKRAEELKVLTLSSVCKRMGRDAVIDTESQDKVVFMSAAGKKLGSFDGKIFR